MELIVRTRNGKVTDGQRRHIEEKLNKLDRYLDQLTTAMVEVTHMQQRHAGEMHRVQVTLTGDHGVILRAEEQAGELYAAVDAVLTILQRQIARYKEKSWRRGKLRRQGNVFVEPPAEFEQAATLAENDDEPQERQITRTKEFRLRPMFTDDAVEQMELLGHTFFVFQDAETEKVSVIYRRNDGNYGLIVPQPV
jgi:putative sigma-54 modulation protein